jgi:hypothetical protein
MSRVRSNRTRHPDTKFLVSARESDRYRQFPLKTRMPSGLLLSATTGLPPKTVHPRVASRPPSDNKGSSLHRFRAPRSFVVRESVTKTERRNHDGS